MTVVICTHNRHDYLAEAIESLLHQSASASQYEILVVDNASTDDTRGLVAGLVKRVPLIRYIYEPRLGLSVARNTGWREARGEFVGYMDDDAVADDTWVSAILESFDEGGPTTAAVGGPVDPLWEVSPPAWLPEDWKALYGIINHGVARKVLAADQYLGGGNSAYRKNCLSNVGGFAENLGRIGGVLLSGEDNGVRNALHKAGLLYFYDPRVRIRHAVPAKRLRQSWLLRRVFWEGVSQSILNHESAVAAVAGASRFLILRRRLAFCLDRRKDLIALLGRIGTPEVMNERCMIAWHLGAGAYRLGLLPVVDGHRRSCPERTSKK
jgi:glycosyltransferase involved in cell wall biosynthesis